MQEGDANGRRLVVICVGEVCTQETPYFLQRCAARSILTSRRSSSVLGTLSTMLHFSSRLSPLLLIVFASPGFTQTEVWKVSASDGQTMEHFGNAVAIEGSYALVGAFHDGDNDLKAGSAYMFNRYTGAELYRIDDQAPEIGDIFAYDVAMEGSLAIIGKPHDNDLGTNSGSVLIHDVATGALIRTLYASDGDIGDHFGNAVAISNGILIIGELEDQDNGKSSGSAFLFDANTGTQLFKLTPQDGKKRRQFGKSVSISGNIALAGSGMPNTIPGSVYSYDVTTGLLIRKMMPSDGLPGDYFGNQIAQEGNIVVIGASGSDSAGNDAGAAYVFDVITGQELLKLQPSDIAPYDQFGYSVSLDGGIAAISALGETTNGIQSGAVYLFDVATGQELAKLTASDGAAFDLFGTDMTLNGTSLLIGAKQDGDMGVESGSAYMFDILGGCMTKFCSPANGSTNNVTVLDGSGCDLSGPITLDLSAAPAGEFTYLLVGASSGIVTNPAGSLGDLCLTGGFLSRYSLDLGAISAAATYSVDISNSASGGPGFGIPSSGGASIQAGQSWNFQYWHRNAGGAPSGFSQAIAITFK